MATAQPNISAKPSDARVIASGAVDIPEDIANQVKLAIVRLLANNQGRTKLKSVRFVPSTKSLLPDNEGFEVLANTTIEIIGTEQGQLPNRSEVIESVVKIKQDGVTKKLVNVSIPGY